MLRGITIIEDQETHGVEMLCTGYDPDAIEGMQFTAAVLRMYVVKTEKQLARAEVLAELSEEQDDKADTEDVNAIRLVQEPSGCEEGISEE